MDNLGFNKVAGAVLATGLAIVGLRELSHIVFEKHEPEKPGYAIAVSEGGEEGGLAPGVGLGRVKALGVASDLRDSIVFKWMEPDSRQGTTIPTTSKTVVARTIALDIRALSEGSYIVSIDVRRGATLFARAERRFAIREQ